MGELICQLCEFVEYQGPRGGFTSDRIWARNFGIPKFDVLLACVLELKVNTAQVSRKQTERDDPSQDRKAGWMDAGIHILYDFSGHKPDLEGKIQICFKYMGLTDQSSRHYDL